MTDSIEKLRTRISELERQAAQLKRAEDALSESERRLRQIIEFLPDATFVIDIEGKVTAWNKAMQALTGLKASAMLGKGDFLYAVPFYGKPRLVLIDMVIAQDQEMASSYPSFHKEGDRLVSEVHLADFMGRGPTWLWVTASPLYDPDGQIVGAIESIRDITGHKRVEEALRESQERYRELVAALPQGVFECDADGFIQYVNDITFEMFGFDREDFFPGKYHVLQMIAPEDRDRAEANVGNLFKSEKSPSAEYLALRKNGSKFPMQVYSSRIMREGVPTGMRGIIIDITERKRAEEDREKLRVQLTQAQKMESVGRLAGGVAHDFNNMLSVILGRTELALNKLSQGDTLRNDLTEIRKAARRSSELTRQLLGYARRQTISPLVLDLNKTLAGMLKMFSRLIGEDIDLAWRPGKLLWPVKMDPSQLDQIVANLCVNARDAIEGVGKVTIETRNVTLDENYCADRPGFEPGDYVMLAVSDDGSGMDKEVLQYLFDPFFTTKELGKGTGLGLATVYGIVKQNEGYINVSSEPGKGTTFKIYIPRHREQPAAATKESGTTPPIGGTETVLLVEDEPTLLKMGKAMLETLGYQVLAAGSPSEAVRLVRGGGQRIDLLVTDVVMPEMNGRELAARVGGLCPGIKTLFMSGYTADVIAHHGVLASGVSFIHKPFTIKDLSIKIKEALSD